MPSPQSRSYPRLSQIALLAILASLCFALRSDTSVVAPYSFPGRMSRLPHRTLWAWERPEDLSATDSSTTAVAWLDQTLLIGSQVHSIPRRQPILYPASATKIAVVRLEVAPGTKLDAMPSSGQEQQVYEATVTAVVAQLLRSADRPGIAALQIDFDATRSQRGFYKRVLRDLRLRMPADLPLSITALASWCSYDDWIDRLPIDEAVPMFFRMEPDRRHAPADLDAFRIREPLCKDSIGISTHERWPDDLAGKRIYIFPDRGWRSDLILLADRNLP